MRPAVLSTESDRGCIEVNSRSVNLKELNGPQGKLEEDTPATVLGKLIQCPCHSVIVQGFLLSLSDF
jgi:hypothetical protein